MNVFLMVSWYTPFHPYLFCSFSTLFPERKGCINIDKLETRASQCLVKGEGTHKILGIGGWETSTINCISGD